VKAEAKEAVAVEQPAAGTNGDTVAESPDVEAGAEADGDDAAESGKKGRFIVFVGMHCSATIISPTTDSTAR
jgi:hypothetical protein